jgi:hypothetical protein
VFSFVQPSIKSYPAQPSLRENDYEGLPGFGRGGQFHGWQGEAGFPNVYC